MQLRTLLTTIFRCWLVQGEETCPALEVPREPGRRLHSCKETGTFLVVIVIVHTMCQFAGVLRVANGAVLPLLVVYEVTPEIKRVVNVAKSKLDEMML